MENSVDNNNAQVGSGVTDSAPVQENQTSETQGNAQQTSSETKNTGNADFMIPKSRFDEVNNKYKAISARQEELKAYEQLDQMLQQDEKLAEEITQVLERRKQNSQPAPKQRENYSQDPVVGTLAKKMAYMEARENVQNYSNDFENAFKNSGIPESAKELYKLHVEQNVLSSLNGELWRPYNSESVKQAFENAKKLLDPLVQQTTQSYVQSKEAQKIPTMKSNPPIQANRFRSTSDRASFIANSLKAGRQV